MKRTASLIVSRWSEYIHIALESDQNVGEASWLAHQHFAGRYVQYLVIGLLSISSCWCDCALFFIIPLFLEQSGHLSYCCPQTFLQFLSKCNFVYKSLFYCHRMASSNFSPATLQLFVRTLLHELKSATKPGVWPPYLVLLPRLSPYGYVLVTSPVVPFWKKRDLEQLEELAAN